MRPSYLPQPGETLISLRRSHEPPPNEDDDSFIFVDQFGDALSIWIRTFHIQIYRRWSWPYLGFESFDEDDDDS